MDSPSKGWSEFTGFIKEKRSPRCSLLLPGSGLAGFFGIARRRIKK